MGSSKLGGKERRALPRTLGETSRAARSLFQRIVPADAEVFRGDSWQLVVAEARAGLRVALFFRAYLRGHSPGCRLDTRVAIGIGPITYLPKNRVSQGDGPAFRASGKALEEMPRNRRLALDVAGGAAPPGIAAVICLIDRWMARWTEKQALAVLGRLQGQTQAQIGQSWASPVKQQVIARHLAQAGWDSIEEGLRYVEDTVEGL